MFFLGAGFMLIETKAVVQMALLFGSTWMVNSIVFCAVLSMILVANLLRARRPAALADAVLRRAVGVARRQRGRAARCVPRTVARACRSPARALLAFTPVLFAGVVFAMSFRHAVDADRAFGANVAGAMVGGLSEYSSMLLGFQYVVLVALAFLRPLRDRLVTEIVPAVGVVRTGPHCQHLAGAIHRGASKTPAQPDRRLLRTLNQTIQPTKYRGAHFATISLGEKSGLLGCSATAYSRHAR